MLCTSLVEKNCEYKQNFCLCKLRTVTEVFTEWHLNELNEVYSFFYLCISSRISDGVFVCITSQLKVHWACTLLEFWVPVTQVWTLLSGVCISDSVSVQLLESAPLVFTVPSFSAGMFCPVRFVCGGSCPCHQSLVTAVLPGLLLAWVRNDFQWRQELHGFPTWMSLFGSRDPEKEQFMMPGILI